MLRIKTINEKYLRIMNVICNCKNQNTNKNMKLQI